MLFHNLGFLLFLAIVYVVYWRLPAGRLWLLAAANAAFYLVAGWANLGLFLGASALTYALGHLVTGPGGRAWAAVGIAANLANLAFFKYAGFLASNVAAVAPGLDLAWLHGVLLPIGISFYTFQHISYLVDRRTRDLPPAPSYLHFWVYISFFGHSIAGPIMRGHEFFPQIAETDAKRWDPAAVRLGLAIFAWGFFKKVAIADHVAPLVGPAFDAPWAATAGTAWAAALLFAFQIYYDFSAYSDMAVGIGLLFGYTLRQNFRTPYVARNASEFWRRWHITLSEWIRDYVYIPLGGNRHGAARAQLNLALAMLASGLWHGANWTFVLWGAWHAALLLGQRALAAARERPPLAWLGARPLALLAPVAFFALTTLGWVLFRARDVETAVLLWQAMLAPAGGPALGGAGWHLALAAGLYGLHWLEWGWREGRPGWRERWLALPTPVRGLAYGGAIVLAMLSSGREQVFIYFQF